MTDQSKHNFFLPQLNGLRFIAFLMIFFVHAPKFFVTTSSVPLFEFNKWINGKMEISFNFGVDLFFCLSAFLITKLLLLEYERKGSISVKNFLVRRVLRIAPLYYLYVVIAFFILPLVVTDDPTTIPAFGTVLYLDTLKQWIIPSLMFFSNNINFPGSMTGHLWSISLEMQIYLTLPFLIYYFVNSKTERNNVKGIMIILLSLFVMTTLLKFTSVILGQPHPKIYLSTLTRLDPFIVGVLIAIKSQYYPGRFKIPFQLPITLLILCLNFILPSPFTPNYLSPVVYIVNAVGFGLLLDYLITRKSYLSKLLSWRPLAFLGDLTYGLYIFHYAVIHFVAKLFKVYNLPLTDGYWFLFVLTAGIATLFISLMSYYLFEKRFLGLKAKFTAVGKQLSKVPS